MDNPLSADLYNGLDQFLGPKLYLLSEKIKNAVDKISVSKLVSERPAKFVYFNAMNLAVKNSIKSSNTVGTTSRPSEFNLSPEALRVLVDISSQHSWWVNLKTFFLLKGIHIKALLLILFQCASNLFYYEKNY